MKSLAQCPEPGRLVELRFTQPSSQLAKTTESPLPSIYLHCYALLTLMEKTLR